METFNAETWQRPPYLNDQSNVINNEANTHVTPLREVSHMHLRRTQHPSCGTYSLPIRHNLNQSFGNIGQIQSEESLKISSNSVFKN